jgi:glutamate-1-semialdehyde 2,1-aminomutase
MEHRKSEQAFRAAQKVMPGGVSSPVRAFGSVGGTPVFMKAGYGAEVTDVDGNRYIDMLSSWGPLILGHADPKVMRGLYAGFGGTSFGAPTSNETRLAKMLIEALPAIEMVRFVSSGTEATMSALRLARGVTGRDRIVKFAGNYHGHSDGLLADAGSAVALIEAGTGDAAGARAVPGSAGVPAGAVADTLVVPYNVVPELDETVAAVIVEPVAANMGLVPPVPGFLAGLRAECDRVGALLILDEVITGFRLGRGGAQERAGVTPDLSCFGKVIGGGLNVGAFGGRAEVMDHLAPLGAVYQAGTLSGNPLATAAGLAALALLDDDAYTRLEATAARLGAGLQAAFDAAGLTVRVPVEGTLVGLYVGADLPVDYDGARRTDTATYARLFHALLDRGVALAPGPYEIMFPGLAHVDAVVDEIVARAGEAADAVAAG